MVLPLAIEECMYIAVLFFWLLKYYLSVLYLAIQSEKPVGGFVTIQRVLGNGSLLKASETFSLARSDAY